MLRKEGVCVIAGVPGIGKTTLAKMLLADAVHDGYEAIQVSADVEEAWNVYAPGCKQAFYYDDFLGRTALVEGT
jgi:MinD superfamily P-loop ATPase